MIRRLYWTKGKWGKKKTYRNNLNKKILIVYRNYFLFRTKKTSPNGDQFLWPVDFTELKGKAGKKKPIEIILIKKY